MRLEFPLQAEQDASSRLPFSSLWSRPLTAKQRYQGYPTEINIRKSCVPIDLKKKINK